MKHFISKALVYLVAISIVIGVVDFIIGKVLKKIEFENRNYYPRLRWNDFYNTKANSMDFFFIGSSHCYRSFNPILFDSLTGKSSFNLGSSAQTPVTTYYILKEAFNSQTPESVIFEIFPGVWQSKNYSTSTKFNYEFIQSEEIKRDLFRYGFKDTKEAFLLNLPVARYKRIVRYGMKFIFGSSLQSPDFEYLSKGFVATYKSNNTKFKKWGYNFDKIQVEQIEHIEKIKALCKSKNVKLSFVISPYNPDYISKCRNYDQVHKMALEMTNGYQLIDFNKSKLSFDPNVDFYDSGHTSYKGANKLTYELVSSINTNKK